MHEVLHHIINACRIYDQLFGLLINHLSTALALQMYSFHVKAFVYSDRLSRNLGVTR